MSVFFDVKTLAVNVSPNPFHDNVIVAISTENKAVLSIDVRDVLGRLVQHFTLNTEGVLNLPIATKDWPSGAYFINVADGQTTVQQKIVKN